MEQRLSFSSRPGEQLKVVFPSHLSRPGYMAERALKLAMPGAGSVIASQLVNLQEFHGLYWQNGQGHNYQTWSAWI